MLRTFFHSGVTCVARDVSFLAMQQLIDLGYVRHICRRAHHAMHQTGFGIDTDVRFQMQPGKLAQNRRFVERLSIAVSL
ncbi:hypothetical protein ABMA08_17040 [Pseudomonas yamanorum]